MDQNRFVYNVSYDIPRVVVAAPGRQNRGRSSEFKITPGMTEPVEIVFGNQDGVPINLVPFQIRLAFWKIQRLDTSTLSVGQSDMILVKTLLVQEPYSGRAVVVLTSEDTMHLAQNGARSLRWGVFLINAQGDVFPMQIAGSNRYGTVHIDVESGIPMPDLIKMG